jgi:Zn-dependent protease with chaperone function
MVMLGLVSAFYLHLRRVWTILIFAPAIFSFLGVLHRLWMARSLERSADRDRFVNSS